VNAFRLIKGPCGIRVRTHRASMTRAELDVVRRVSEGLGSKDVAARHG
jgi:DNA-binding CsgD family transcriptional regulator